jgi:hypothetical protein
MGQVPTNPATSATPPTPYFSAQSLGPQLNIADFQYWESMWGQVPVSGNLDVQNANISLQLNKPNKF